MAKKYYLEFKKQLEEKHKDLTIATIYSYAPNEEDNSNGILEDEEFETDLLDQSSREFLDFVIGEYNKKFKTNFSSEGNGFQDYYKDLSDRVKNREVDLLIVVNMFLTGFDATTLNTLWVDKNLKQHGLIQAYSRTNRILNSVKTYGNIVCFRDLEEATNDAIALFGDKNASGIVLLKSYEDYYYGYEDDKGRKQLGYEERIATLLQKYPLGEQIIGEQHKKDFIVLMGNILRLRNILSSFDKFAGNEILSERDFQDYIGTYTDLYEEYKSKPEEEESIKEDIVFEMELVKQVEVNIDYILMLVAKYHQSNCEDKEILGTIDKAIKSSLALRSKKELIDGFISKINADTNVMDDWGKFVKEQKEIDLKKIIGSSNEYVEKDEEKDIDWQNLIPDNQGTSSSNNGSEGTQDSDGTTNNQGGALTGTNAGTSNGGSGSSTGGDTIINNNTETNKTPLSKSVSLRGAIATSSYIDIEYAVQDPENRYQTVYAFIEAVGYENTIALDKNTTTYRLTDLEPNTEYKITLGYKEITEDNEVVDNIEDVLSVRTTKINASLDVTRVSTGSKKVYFNLKLDQNYAFDYAKIALYVDGVKESDMDVNLSQAVKSEGWSDVLTYENYGSEITLILEGTSHDGSIVETNIQTKYRNY